MLDQLQEAFPQIDWSEGNDPHAVCPLVDGPLNEDFRVVVFRLDAGPPSRRRVYYEAHLLRARTSPKNKDRNRRPLLRCGPRRVSPAAAVKSLVMKSVIMGDAIAALHDNFL